MILVSQSNQAKAATSRDSAQQDYKIWYKTTTATNPRSGDISVN